MEGTVKAMRKWSFRKKKSRRVFREYEYRSAFIRKLESRIAG